MGVSQLFTNFYSASDKTNKPQIGDIYYLPTPEVTDYKVLEVVRATPEAHTQVDYRAVQFDDSRHFSESVTSLPIALLKINAGSEALLIKAKKRPCVVLGIANVHIDEALEADRLSKKTFSLPIYLVAPLFSCSSPTKQTSFNPIMTARIKALQYQHFCYMKDINGKEPGSILRLDHIFPSKIGVGTQKCDLKVDSEVMQLIQAQAFMTLGLDTSTSHIEYLQLIKDTIAESLPDELKV